MRISRIYNNNVALATTFKGQEIVVIGKGLAFGKRKGDMIDPTKVEQTFVPDASTTNERLTWSLEQIPSEILSLATELEQQVTQKHGIKIAHSFIIPLADHLNYALVRAQEGVTVDYPLTLEVTQLYPTEVEFGYRALQLVLERTGVKLPENEAIPLALHLVNSQFDYEDMSRTFRMTEVFAQIFDIIGTSYGHEVDQTAMSVARFVTHLRYLFVRTDQKAQARASAETSMPLVTEAMRTSYPKAFACARKVLLLLEMHLSQELTDDELTYLAIHIARLARELWDDDSTETVDA
ncbi:PRD domain-containing protein [Rothia sp. ZJ1223]|uniref:PRD domain-containing protein n=1 Tax=Rothia sp. ZJ1223 TaxID=2811098 RepID=UPI001958BCB7|nr:PRD domain-containing protein [Rothia sp. ZJ1223]MBM7052091.1 PRD domain-containing protein [Rothia sp. ZJ1223]